MDDLSLRNYWKFTAGTHPAADFWNDFIKNKRIVMGHRRVINKWTNYSRKQLYRAARARRPIGNVPRQFVDLYDMKKGDVVVCKQGARSRVLGIGFVSSNTRLIVTNHPHGYPNGRHVYWLRGFTGFDYKTGSPFYREFSSVQDTVHRIASDAVKNAIMRKVASFLVEHKPDLRIIERLHIDDESDEVPEDPYFELPKSDWEGRKKYVDSIRRERSRRLIEAKKDQFLALYGHLYCEVCKFDFASMYGIRGKDFIECHHRNPVSKYKGQTKTKLDDLCILCSNCHRMIHHKHPWDSVERLKQRVGLKVIEIVQPELSARQNSNNS